MTSKKQIAKALVAELLASHKRTCWVPEIGDPNGTTLESQYFGSPWMDATEQWPILCGLEAQFVLQLDVASLPKEVSDIFGGIGLIQFFYQTQDVDLPEDLSSLSLVRLVDPGKFTGSNRIPPKISTARRRSKKTIVGWKARDDFPRSEDYADLGIEGPLEKIAEQTNQYFDEIVTEALQGDKLSGWPFWTQANDTPQDSHGDLMIPIYQIDAGCFYDGPRVKAYARELFAGDGTGHIFVSKNNPRELCFLWATG